jgi:hypothetical protein
LSTFKDSLSSSLDILKYENYFKSNATVVDLMELIEKCYDGYSWDGDKQVFNPFSLAN